MSNERPQHLPIIDINPFLSPSSAEKKQIVATAIDAACRDFGFFYLTGHGISTRKLDHIISLAREFFALPLEEKERIKRYDAGGKGAERGGDAGIGDGARGYQGVGENVTQGKRDMHEAVDWYREWDWEEETTIDGSHAANGDSSNRHGGRGPPYKILQGPNLWPQRPAELKDTYLEYIEQVKHVGTALVRAMGMALGLPSAVEESAEKKDTQDQEIFVRNTERSFWVMRMIGYPPLFSASPSAAGSAQSSSTSSSSPGSPDISKDHDAEDDLAAFSCGSHTDYGCTTLLLTDPTPSALQVRLHTGHWLTADPIRGAFVVNIGDMLERWSNGLWKSTLHRVIHRGDGYRVSVPFFFEPNFDALIEPLEKCVQETGGVSRFDKVRYGDHLLGKVAENFY